MYTIKEILAQDGTGMLVDQKISTFETLLRSTGREGVENIIGFFRKTDFYTAPASSQYHSNYNGGLLDHSLAVYAVANEMSNMYINMKPELAEKMPKESVIIVSLLHDICKTCMYSVAERYRKDDQGRWETYMGYTINDTFPIGHGEKSVIMLQNFGLQMTGDEMIAIRYHMGMWGGFFDEESKATYHKAVDAFPLAVLLQIADYSASQLMEITIKQK